MSRFSKHRLHLLLKELWDYSLQLTPLIMRQKQHTLHVFKVTSFVLFWKVLYTVKKAFHTHLLFIDPSGKGESSSSKEKSGTTLINKETPISLLWFLWFICSGTINYPLSFRFSATWPPYMEESKESDTCICFLPANFTKAGHKMEIDSNKYTWTSY